MYTSTGGGMIGAGQHQVIHAPAARFLKTVEAILDSLPATADAPMPRSGQAAVVALMFEGMRRGPVDEESLKKSSPT